MKWPALALLALLTACAAPPPRPPLRPNVVVIFVDDLGYADIGPFGGAIPTPNLDRMAREGLRCTDFAVTSAVCSASRASLLTGCYHQRVGIAGALGPDAQIGLHEDETTLAELCRQQGYATACFGKWHLGHHPKFLPQQHGFDEFFGLPYSNDMWPLHPAHANLPPDSAARKRGYPDLPLLEGETIVVPAVQGSDQAQLTRRYTERAVDFITRHRDRPFFLYLPHTMVHVPVFASERFAGKSGHGTYGDVVQEIDWSVGEVLAALARAGVDDRTLVLFTSDNGPWLSYGAHAGSAGPLREGKGTAFEGGVRVPTLVRWPGRVPAGAVCHQFAATIDVLPTVAKLIGAPLPPRPIDGLDIGPLWFGGPGAVTPHELFACYYDGGQLQAVRDGRWKLHFPHKYATLAGRPGGTDGRPAPYTTASIGRALFDLANDPGETRDVAAEFPEVVARLEAGAARLRRELGDALTGTKGQAARAPGRLGPGDRRLW
ncbi:MAG: sulfatase [Planctomycetes bacterium]|nr:sulfatase [Planctomycetota bacterium]